MRVFRHVPGIGNCTLELVLCSCNSRGKQVCQCFLPMLLPITSYQFCRIVKLHKQLLSTAVKHNHDLWCPNRGSSSGCGFTVKWHVTHSFLDTWQARTEGRVTELQALERRGGTVGSVLVTKHRKQKACGGIQGESTHLDRNCFLLSRIPCLQLRVFQLGGTWIRRVFFMSIWHEAV
jgi:hypothetical protein